MDHQITAPRLKIQIRTLPAGDIYWSGGRAALSITDLRSRNIRSLDEVEASSVDLYAALRSLYRQHRNAEIRNGAPDTQNLPNL